MTRLALTSNQGIPSRVPLRGDGRMLTETGRRPPGARPVRSAATPSSTSSRRDAPQRDRAGTHEATGTPAQPPPSAADRPAFAAMYRDYLASRIEASVAPPGRVLTVLPTVLLALLPAGQVGRCQV